MALLATSGADAVSSGVSNAVVELVKTGLLGTLLALAGAFAIYLLRELNKSQNARIEDQKALTATLLKFTESMNGVVQDFKSALEALKTTTDEERRAIGLIDAGIAENGRTLDALKGSADESRRQHDEIRGNLQELLRRRGGER